MYRFVLQAKRVVLVCVYANHAQISSSTNCVCCFIVLYCIVIITSTATRSSLMMMMMMMMNFECHRHQIMSVDPVPRFES